MPSYDHATPTAPVPQAYEHGEEFFRAAFLASSIPSALVSLDGHVFRANVALEKLLGHEPGGLTGLRVTDFTDKPDVELTETAIVRGREPEMAVMELRKRYLRRDGTAIDTLASVATVRDAAGTPLYYTTQIIDLTELRRAEVALIDRERVFARLAAIQQEIVSAAMDESALVPLIVDRACELVDADAAMVEVIDGDSLVVRPGSRIRSPGAPARIRIAGSVAGAAIQAREAVYCPDTASDARARAILEQHPTARSVVCVPLLYNGEASGVLGVIADRADAFSARSIDLIRLLAGFAAAALNHARDFTRFRALTEQSADPLITMMADGRVTYVSPSFEKVFGQPGDSLLGKGAFDLVHPEDRLQALEAIRGLIATPGKDFTGEFRVKHVGETWRNVRLTARNLLAEPAVAALVLSLHDVTDERRLATQLRQAQKLEAVGQLAGGVAHDFNNILTVIGGNSEFLGMQLKENAAAMEDVMEIQRAAARATALTRQLLAFSRRQVMQAQVVDLNAIVGGLRPMLGRLIGEDIDFVIATGESPIAVYADPHQMEQVVMNLSVNARDAMPAGGRLEVAVWVQELERPQAFETHTVMEGRYAVLTVSDTGMGMTRQVRDQIFNPFFTTKEQGRGTGLGLSTVYGIVKQSGGYIDVQSEPGKGTRFRIYLPLVDEELPSRPVAIGRAASKASGTVLLVEDDPAVRAIARRILLRDGYHVLDAPGPEEAVRIAAANRGALDVLLTDVVMPKMNGRQLWEAIRGEHPNAAVVYMSGYTDDDIITRGGVLGTQVRLVGKPFTPAELLDAIREALKLGSRQ